MFRRRSFAVIPAAGRSVRMGTPKLLLPISGQLLIERTLEVWCASGVDRVAVVCRSDDDDVQAICRQFPVEVASAPKSTRDMRASLEIGVAQLEAVAGPRDGDALVVAPADMPRLSVEAINAVLRAFAASKGEIVLPTYQGRDGHPVEMAWRRTQQLRDLPSGAGLNCMVLSSAVRRVVWHDDAVTRDLDTPDDWRRLIWSRQ
ncbi:MAG: nucleotidyltransferase family protein [Planctomycetales bacterium]|nr:nucleotidyltransferase family protein [Planctomycetales bacterium]